MTGNAALKVASALTFRISSGIHGNNVVCALLITPSYATGIYKNQKLYTVYIYINNKIDLYVKRTYHQ
jgi:hypothetical protein